MGTNYKTVGEISAINERWHEATIVLYFSIEKHKVATTVYKKKVTPCYNFQGHSSNIDWRSVLGTMSEMLYYKYILLLSNSYFQDF